MTGQTCLLDELREQHPDLAFAIYAMEPGGRVTFEVLTPDGQLFNWHAPTAVEAVQQAFPPKTNAPVEDDPPEEPAPNIFD